MKTRTLMRHRTTIQRDTTVSDGGGGYTDGWSDHVTHVPCHAWVNTDQDILEGGDRPEAIEMRELIVPRDIDVKVGDRIEDISNRREDKVLFSGPFRVDSVSERPDHLKLTVKKVG